MINYCRKSENAARARLVADLPEMVIFGRFPKARFVADKFPKRILHRQRARARHVEQGLARIGGVPTGPRVAGEAAAAPLHGGRADRAVLRAELGRPEAARRKLCAACVADTRGGARALEHAAVAAIGRQATALCPP